MNLNTSKAEYTLIHQIVERAVAMDGNFDRMSLEMDISATHLNGCPLDLQRLLEFDAFNFAHDIYGINNCIDRETGQLTKLFLPRCSR